MSVSSPARTTGRRWLSRGRGGPATSRRRNIGWLFVAPFGAVFVVFLVAPLAYAFGLSLFTKGLATGTTFSGLENYRKAFTDPHFLSGLAFVVKFAFVLIPIQLALALAVALVLDAATTFFAKFTRLVVFLPYAIPAVIGTLMWGFLYSPNFGPLQQVFGLFGVDAPSLLTRSTIFAGLINIVTWLWTGYFMIIIYAALQSVDRTLYEAARIDGASAWQIAVRIKIPMVTSSLLVIVVFALIGTLQFFTEPMILEPVSNGVITDDFTPNIYAYRQAFAYANFNYAAALSFALAVVVMVTVLVFLLVTRKRGGILR